MKLKVPPLMAIGQTQKFELELFCSDPPKQEQTIVACKDCGISHCTIEHCDVILATIMETYC